MIRASTMVARLAWTRMWRGRALWVSASLALLAVVFALLQLARPGAAAATRFHDAAELWLRFLVTVVAAVHLANAVGEEIETQTYTYLWVRPIPRASVLLGKLAAALPALAGFAAVTLAVIYVITTGAAAGTMVPAFSRALGAVVVGVVAASVFAAGVGAIFHRHPFIVTLGWLLGVDQLLAIIPRVGVLSILHQARVVGGLASGSVEGALTGLVLVAAIALVVGIRRLRTLSV